MAEVSALWANMLTSKKTYLWLIAAHAFHLLERLVKRICALLKSSKDTVVLLLVQLVTRLALLGRIDHHLDDALAKDGRAQLDGDELVDFLRNFRIEADELEVTTTMTALADHALGHRVQRGQLDVVVLARLLLLEIAQCLLERDELANEDIGLVDFIGDDNETFLCSELEDGANVLSR